MHGWEKCQDKSITPLPKDGNTTELELRFQFHKQFKAGALTNRAGLGVRKKKDRDLIKYFLHSDENY